MYSSHYMYIIIFFIILSLTYFFYPSVIDQNHMYTYEIILYVLFTNIPVRTEESIYIYMRRAW